MGARLTTEYVIERFKQWHGEKYDYSKTKYIKDDIKVTVICPMHGEFLINANKHMNGQGCKKCGYLKSISNRRLRILKQKFEGIQQPDDYKIIPLTKGAVTYVDNEDFYRLKDICWKISTDGYGNHTTLGELSRYITNAPEHLHVDHIDGNPLNNRRSNLRLCTRSENQCNRVVNRGKSKYKGVQWNREVNKWIANITKNGKTKRIGTFDTEEEAARAYNEYAKKLHGEFAKLNIIS